MGLFGGKKLRCPKCKSEDVSVQMMEAGSETKKSGNGLGGNAWNAARGIAAISTLGMSNLVVPKAKGKSKTKVVLQKVCLCQHCGHDWILK